MSELLDVGGDRGLMHGDDVKGPANRKPVRVDRREKPKAAVGEWGTIADCKPGDVVCLEVTKKLALWAVVAWTYPDGSAMMRLWDMKRRKICLSQCHLRHVPHVVRVRFVELRP